MVYLLNFTKNVSNNTSSITSLPENRNRGILLCLNPPILPSGCMIHLGETPKSQHIFVLMAIIYYLKVYQAQPSNAKGIWDGVQWKAGMIFQRSSPNGITPDMLILSQWQLVWNTTNQSSSLETHCSEFSLNADYVSTLCQIYTNIPDSQKESRCLI